MKFTTAPTSDATASRAPRGSAIASHLCLSLLLAVSLVLTNPTSASADEAKKFSIVAWNMIDPENPALGYFKDPNQFEIMKDCGFNVAGMLTPSLLYSAEQAGMKGWLMVPELHSALDRLAFEKVQPTDQMIEQIVEKMVKEYDNNPAVYGYYVKDEPSASLFPLIAKIGSEIEKRSKKPWYVNLLPTYASAVSQLGSESYDAYVRDFIKICKPKYLAYDHYALMEGGKYRPGYWENMNRFYSIAKEHDLPVIPVIQSVAHCIYRDMTEADLLFQVFSHLAYGAKGIQYFTYFSPRLGNYRNAPIDQFGSKTPTWYLVQKINRRLDILAPKLMDLEWVRSYHFGNAIPVEYGVVAADELSLVKEVKNHDGTTPNVLIGELNDPSGANYVMVVNKDLSNSINVAMTFKTTPKSMHEFGRWSGKLEPWTGENAWLAPGEGVLMKVVFE
jgi:hypothetical protein